MSRPYHAIDEQLIARLCHEARLAPRRRTHYNIHPSPRDPVQRFLNVMQPGTYVRPHRHLQPPRWEFTLALQGAATVLLLDDSGRVRERLELAPAGPLHAVELPAGTWHTVVALAPDTVLLELKEGPYLGAAAEKDFAAWAPPEGDPACPAWVERFAAALPGEVLAASVEAT